MGEQGVRSLDTVPLRSQEHRLRFPTLLTMPRVIVLMLLVLSESMQVDVKTKSFVRLTGQPLAIGLKFTKVSLTYCAALCLATSSCSSFYYQQTTGNCSLGSWLLTSEQIGDGDIYSDGKICDTANGFKIISKGNVIVCVYISSDLKSYIEAREACRGKNSHLYTPKNQDKLDIYLDIAETYSNKIWFGLNDLVTEGTFVWEDDGTVIDQSWMATIFLPGQPDDSLGNEDCGANLPGQSLLNDDFCYKALMYICEVV